MQRLGRASPAHNPRHHVVTIMQHLTEVSCHAWCALAGRQSRPSLMTGPSGAGWGRWTDAYHQRHPQPRRLPCEMMNFDPESSHSACLPACLPGCPSVWLSVLLPVWHCLAGWLSGCLAAWLPGCLAAWLPSCLPACLAACLPACVSNLTQYLSWYVPCSTPEPAPSGLAPGGGSQLEAGDAIEAISGEITDGKQQAGPVIQDRQV
jgi:hypothetical protein